MPVTKRKAQKSFTPLLAIGDLHGSYDRLMEILDRYKQFSRYIFTGDYMDRGKQSIKTAEKVIELIENGKAVGLVGNHDMFFIATMAGDEAAFRDWIGNGGAKVFPELGPLSSFRTGLEYKQHKIIQNPRLQELASAMRKNLKLFHIENDTLFIHAGLPYFRGKFQPYNGKVGLAGLTEMEKDFKSGNLPYSAIYTLEYDDRSACWLSYGTSVIWAERDWLEHLTTDEEVKENFIKRQNKQQEAGFMVDYELKEFRKKFIKKKLDKILKEFRVKRIVHSHDPYIEARSFYKNRVINIDCAMADVYGGFGGALIFDKNSLKTYNHKTKKVKVLEELGNGGI
ncbi:metallophosphoesterase [Candidatus Margulisiibacteriota bacterium]